MPDDLDADPPQPSNSPETLRSKADLAVEVRRLLLAHERKTHRPVKRATLAKAIGVSVSSLYAYLNGTTLPPTDTFDRLLDALGVPAAERRRLSTARDNLDVHGALPATSAPPPQELPSDVFGFTGRAEQLAELDRMLALSDKGVSAVVISALSGTAGVGKTSLAVHWAHRVRDRFPDGQLYVDLRGYDPSEPMRPVKALETFLRGLGVSGLDIPNELPERAARYRTLLADKQMLVVLDNAHSTEQIRDLLPGTSSCFVIVTSRDSLAGLVARHGARRVDIDLLPTEDAVSLLRTLIGDRVAAEPAAAAVLAERCARLPLALRIAAEIAIARPTMSLVDLVAELEKHRLDMFGAGGDQRTAVRAVFSWSYKHLRDDSALVFRLLGLHPGPDFDPYVAAAVANLDLGDAKRLLTELVDVHLVQQLGAGRYRFHDLLRAYAAQLAAETDTTDDRRAALSRLFDYHLHTASAAMDVIAPEEKHHRPDVPAPGTPVPALHGYEQAMTWVETERPNLLAAAEHAAGHGWPAHTSHLSVILWRYFHICGHRDDALTLHTRALATAKNTGNRVLEGHALNNLGSVYWQLGLYDEALARHQQALDVARDTGNRVLEGHARYGVGFVYSRVGQLHEALTYLQSAVAFAGDTGNRPLEGRALSNIGLIYWQLGRYDQALGYHQQALAIAHDIDDHTLEGAALDNLGSDYERLGRYDQALPHHQQALDVAYHTRNRYLEGYALKSLGSVYERLGRYDQALAHHQRALEVAQQTGNRSLETEALNSLGETTRSCLSMDPADTLDHHQRALDLAGKIGDRYEQARAHDGLAHAHQDLDHPLDARHHWQQALAIYTELGVPEADQARTQLAGLDN
ncbi:ATP-binding protein [Amycolatopsis anabasis]|uniref:ATP-binding protein n=1 Tax=Amycolatopsis anabasis TaxID=1840409 RepID=UPI00131B9271|nr:tetratricopeptide repeat protein [Amycolatopsis anabasis]